MDNYISYIPNFEAVSIEGYEEFSNYYPDCLMQTKDWLLSNLQHNSVFIDVGAKEGILSLTAGKKISSKGQIIAIEPSSTFDLLKRNLKRKDNNHISPTRLLKATIGNKNERGDITGSHVWDDNMESQIVNSMTLDELVKSLNLVKVDVIKIDAAIFNLDVLAGASKLITQYQPAVIIEIKEDLEKRNATPDQIFDYFLDHRYTDIVVADKRIYIFTSNWEIGHPWPNNLRLTRWRKSNYTEVRKGRKFETNVSVKRANSHIIFDEKTKISKGSLAKWDYILEITGEIVKKDLPIVVEIDGTLRAGKISAVMIANDYKTLISDEKEITQLGNFRIEIATRNFENKAVIRNINEGFFDFEIEKIDFYHGIIDAGKISEYPVEQVEKIGKNALFQKLKLPLSQMNDQAVDLHKHQGWLMEQSSNHLLVQLIKNYDKAKVLEIGTWEGFTCSTLVKNTNAEIWSVEINPVISESGYVSRYQNLEENQGIEAGWLYRRLDYLGRVHQIFADSALYDWEKFTNNFFDFVFIDGDHKENSVKTDTLAIFPKVKSGGIVIWDDYNYEGEFITLAEQGVNDFVAHNIAWLDKYFELYYVEGTQFLIGKKR